MSVSQTNPDPSLQALSDEGFEIEVIHQHLLVHGIPYVSSSGEVCQGVLAAPYTGIGQEGVSARPKDHTVWFSGQIPHHATSRKPMNGVINNSSAKTLFTGFTVNHRLSNKRNGKTPDTFYELISHYHALFSAEAQVIDPNADGRSGVVRPNRDPKSVFLYPDTASCRAGITEMSERVNNHRIAIIGVGGTGSYILDLLAKSSVPEIHLFGGDIFDSHNAFRSPGAFGIEDINRKMFKSDFFKEKYEVFRSGIVSHPYMVTTDNVTKLDNFDCVFISIDNGQARKMISGHLASRGKLFIDTGIGMDTRPSGEDGALVLSAACRVTVSSSEKSDHLGHCLDYSTDKEDLYTSNIQIADMNAINAAIAVARWRQQVGIYQDQTKAHNLLMSFSLQSLSRGEILEETCPE